MWNCAVFEKTLFDTRLRNSSAFSNAKVAFRNLESKMTILLQFLDLSNSGNIIVVDFTAVIVR
jgi:hypothetical protein